MTLTKEIINTLMHCMAPNSVEEVVVAPNAVSEAVAEVCELHGLSDKDTKRIAIICEALANELVAEPGRYK